MNTAEILTKAKSLIEKPENWIQGQYTKGECQYCAEGAIYIATPRGESATGAVCVLQVVVGSSIPQWNDAIERKHEEVIEAFDKAIALAKGQP